MRLLGGLARCFLAFFTLISYTPRKRIQRPELSSVRQSKRGYCSRLIANCFDKILPNEHRLKRVSDSSRKERLWSLKSQAEEQFGFGGPIFGGISWELF